MSKFYNGFGLWWSGWKKLGTDPLLCGQWVAQLLNSDEVFLYANVTLDLSERELRKRGDFDLGDLKAGGLEQIKLRIDAWHGRREKDASL